MKTSVIMACLCFIILVACRKEDDLFQPQFSNSEITNDEDLFLNAIDRNALILPSSTDFAAIPQDPKNPLTTEKVQLGQLLFHETRLGGKPKVIQGLFTYSCGTCHHAEAGFQSGLAQAIGEGAKALAQQEKAAFPFKHF